MFDWEHHFRSMSSSPSGSVPRSCAHYSTEFGGGFTAVITDNLNATNAYMHQTAPKTPQATQLLSEWAKWWASTGDPENYVFYTPDAVWDEARNRRLAYDVANAPNAAAAQSVIDSAKHSQMTTEEQQGKQRRDDPTTGGYYPPPRPPIPSWVVPVLIGAAALGIGVSVVPMLRRVVLPFP